MPDGDRTGVIATVVVVIAVAILTAMAIWDMSAKHALYSIQAHQRAAEHAENANQQIQQACTFADLTRQTNCIEEIIVARNEAQRAEYNLQAQRNMADWSWYVVVVSGLMLFVTGAGVYLIYRTLLYTRDAAFYTGTAADASLAAVREARSTAKAAREANELNRQAINAQERGTTRQLRAYMHVSNATVEKIGDSADRTVFVGIKNYGQTPAYEVITKVATVIQKWPLDTELADPPEDLPAAKAPMPPGREWIAETAVAKPNPFEERELLAGRAAIYCWGIITYKVPVEATAGFMVVKSHRTHETRFRLACRGEGLASGNMHHTEEGNSAT